MNDMTPNRTAAQNSDAGWRYPDWEVAYDVWVRDAKETRRKSFKTEQAMLTFLDKAEEKDNWGGLRGTRYPQYS